MVAPTKGSEMSGRRLVRSDELDEQIRRKGWTTVDLLDASTVGALRDSYERLPNQITVDRSFAAGFHATIMDGRTAYRHRAHDVISDAVASPFDRLFDRMKLTLTNWLHKEPGAAAVPFHVDWSFVDESLHRSLSVWSPLVDTDERTGCIGVVDGSHLLTRFVRASAHPGYAETQLYGERLPGRRLVPLRAGQAVVFDHRLVHFSAPHAGSGPRVAISCELVPEEAHVLHYEYLGPGLFRRHRVTSDFFVGYTAGDDPTNVEGHLETDLIAALSFDQMVDATESGDRPATPPSWYRTCIQRLFRGRTTA